MSKFASWHGFKFITVFSRLKSGVSLVVRLYVYFQLWDSLAFYEILLQYFIHYSHHQSGWKWLLRCWVGNLLQIYTGMILRALRHNKVSVGNMVRKLPLCWKLSILQISEDFCSMHNQWNTHNLSLYFPVFNLNLSLLNHRRGLRTGCSLLDLFWRREQKKQIST